MKTLVSVSFCASHWKGGNPGDAGVGRMPGEEHCRWLEEAVNLYRSHGLGLDTIVVAVDYPGILDVETRAGNEERDVLWRIVKAGVPILGIHHNPGHQVGAALTIRMGLECAARCGYDILIHTAEDILPTRGSLELMIGALEEGADYVGEPWGPDGRERNTQFFGCRPQALVGPWDACQVPAHGCVERYLADLLGDRPQHLVRGLYRTTHDYGEWRRWKQEQENATNPEQ